MEPTPIQSDELLRMAGAARFAWNWALERCQTFYKQNHKGLEQSQLSRELTELKSKQPWPYDFDSQSLQQVLRNLEQAYENHFNPKMRSGFPGFKTKKNTKQSFRIPPRVVLKDGREYVPKLGWVKIRQSQEMHGETPGQWKCKALWNDNHALQADRFFPRPSGAGNAGTRTKTSVFRIGSASARRVEQRTKGSFNPALNLRDEGISQLAATES